MTERHYTTLPSIRHRHHHACRRSSQPYLVVYKIFLFNESLLTSRPTALSEQSQKYSRISFIVAVSRRRHFFRLLPTSGTAAPSPPRYRPPLPVFGPNVPYHDRTTTRRRRGENSGVTDFHRESTLPLPSPPTSILRPRPPPQTAATCVNSRNSRKKRASQTFLHFVRH